MAKVGSLPLWIYEECSCQECQNHTGLQEMSRTRFDKEAFQEEWEEEQYILCPPRVLGYILSEKQWAQLKVNTLKDIPKVDPNRSWDRVKLADGEKTKKVLLNLVQGHGVADTGDADNRDLIVPDIVTKKGKGLVILLYGELSTIHGPRFSTKGSRTSRCGQDIYSRDCSHRCT